MVKPRIHRTKRQQRGTLKKVRCPSCHKKRVMKFHQCSGKTREHKTLERIIDEGK